MLFIKRFIIIIIIIIIKKKKFLNFKLLNFWAQKSKKYFWNEKCQNWRG